MRASIFVSPRFFLPLGASTKHWRPASNRTADVCSSRIFSRSALLNFIAGFIATGATTAALAPTFTELSFLPTAKPTTNMTNFCNKSESRNHGLVRKLNFSPCPDRVFHEVQLQTQKKKNIFFFFGKGVKINSYPFFHNRFS
jgi:hypothetical protein